MEKSLDSFYLNKIEPNKSCLLILRDILLNHDSDITETLKYGMPCFCYNGKMLFFLWVEKKSSWPYVLFVNGNKINHPKLDREERKQTKIYRIDPMETFI